MANIECYLHSWTLVYLYFNIWFHLMDYNYENKYVFHYMDTQCPQHVSLYGLSRYMDSVHIILMFHYVDCPYNETLLYIVGLLCG